MREIIRTIKKKLILRRLWIIAYEQQFRQLEIIDKKVFIAALL